MAMVFFCMTGSVYSLVHVLRKESIQQVSVFFF